MKTDFDQCFKTFSANTTEGQALRTRWGWNGTIIGIAFNATTQISREGCIHVCGGGINNYPWSDASSTLTTWILPIMGTMLQAPFESNATKRTFLAITRWVGSPIASLSYVLWNIKVSAKAALMVDMAVPYGETPDRKTDFGSMRDSMYLLLVMNQYMLNPAAMRREKEAEGLLRIVLFSKDLKLTDTDKTLRHMRRILARELREMRRRGVVPVFISIMWFLFAFALSIEAAFGAMGRNTTAHDLALGCLLAWFPVLIMGSIVDRNPIGAEAIRLKLNALVDHVRHALRDPEHRAEFIETFRDQPEFTHLEARVNDVAEKGEHMYEFFKEFAGQARVRWHYGAAHPILSDIENCYIADKGRNWLANEREARANLVLGPVNDEGLVWFDVREFWQVWSAAIIVASSCGGAFVLSYFTPTVGLGCRSGGYTIFFSIAVGLLIVEMTVWLILSPYEVEAPWLTRTATRLQSNATFVRWEDEAQGRWRGLKRRASRFRTSTEEFLVRCVLVIVLMFPWKEKDEMKERVEGRMDRMLSNLKDLSPQKKWDMFFFRPVETGNSIWLVYIVLAQTFGWYKTCACVTSTWGGGGGYLDFSLQDTSNSPWVKYYWTAGTVLTASVLSLSMFYITVEWCQQSFLSTEDYPAAMKGLRDTRRYRYGTFWIRRAWRAVSRYTIDPLETVALYIGLLKRPQKTILWTRHHTWNPPIAHNLSATPPPPHHHHYRPPGSPSIELTDYSTVAPDSHQYTTPAMAHSLFPPAITPRKQRHMSDASSFSPPTRTSDESSRPLIQRPQHSHTVASMASQGGVGMQRNPSDDTRRVSFDDMQSPVSPPEGSAAPVFGGWLGSSGGSASASASGSGGVQGRMGYRRADSGDATAGVGLGMGGLGIVIAERERRGREEAARSKREDEEGEI